MVEGCSMEEKRLLEGDEERAKGEAWVKRKAERSERCILTLIEGAEKDKRDGEQV